MSLKFIGQRLLTYFRKIILILIVRVTSKNDKWIFQDRIDKASDNAEVMYEYVKNNYPNQKIYFILKKNTGDYKRLQLNGFNVIPYGSLKHYMLLYNSEFFITSHLNENILKPWRTKYVGINPPRYKLIFLQHGVCRSDLSHWFNKKNIDLLITSSNEEYSNILENRNYKIDNANIALTGLARHDRLISTGKDYILIFPTWRSYLENDPNAIQSDFAKIWLKQIEEISNNININIKIVLHSSLQILENDFENEVNNISTNIEFIRYNDVSSFTELIKKASCLITDFSSISFDFIYIKKPVIYYLFEEDKTHFTNSNPDYEIYDRLGYISTDSTETINRLNGLINVDFEVDANKIEYMNQFFAYSDKKNCERIYKEIIKRRKNEGN